MSSHLPRSASALPRQGLVRRSSTHCFLGVCLGGSEERNSSADWRSGILHTLSASSSSSTQGTGELNGEGVALSETRREPSLGTLDAPGWDPSSGSTEHCSKAGDAAVSQRAWSRGHHRPSESVLQRGLSYSVIKWSGGQTPHERLHEIC